MTAKHNGSVAPKITNYEKNQRFNPLVSWLHSFRHAHALQSIETLAVPHPDRPLKVVEIGCAHGQLFPAVNQRYNIDYVGIEPWHKFVKRANAHYGEHPNFKVIQGYAEDHFDVLANADVIVALETLEHIPEHTVVRIVEAVAAAKPKLFICSVPVEVGPAIWLKNIGSFFCGYMRHKEYTWKETFWAGLGQLDKLPPHGTDHKGFDWRWLAQTIRHNLKILKLRRFPFGLAPAQFSSSVFFICEPYKT
ncbi:class I SAM-dependent methyltransferase [Microbulbifer sp. MCCC 1A16149]|uniref:class I SAM-dependent methyltransferase n=1 Tax=Microbulbifer sp. MCCC 1A16149 TaxID=3411322 RepID=UPI003D0DCC6E